MKTLLAGIVLIVVLGLGGFLYRNTIEQAQPEVACTLEARVCPDGTTVGRTGPACEFAPCPFPNVFMPEYAIAFALPDGYVADTSAQGDTLVGAFIKTSTTTNALQTISIRSFPITASSTPDEVILEHTRLQPADIAPKDMNAFKPKIIGNRTFSVIVIERFEGVVHSAYYLPREQDVLMFDIVEQDVEHWSSATLIPDNLPHHQALIKMLGTLRFVTPEPQ